MSIEAGSIPVRSKAWTQADARQAYDLLVGNVRDEDGNLTDEKVEAQAAIFGRAYESESHARTQGMALDRLIESQYGQRFGCSVWVGEDGKYVGALAPRPPHQRSESGKRKGTKK